MDTITESGKTISLIFEISTYILWLFCFVHAVCFHAKEFLHVSYLVVSTISMYGLFAIFAKTMGLKYSSNFFIFIGSVPLWVGLFWGAMLHVSFVPSRLFNKHQRGFLLGSVVIDALQIFSNFVAFEPVAVSLGLWSWDKTLDEYYGAPVIIFFSFLITPLLHSIFYHGIVKGLKKASTPLYISLLRYLAPIISAIFYYITISTLWIFYAWIGGIKCIFPFIPTERKPINAAYPKAMQLALLGAFFLPTLISSYYYARYYRLTNKFTIGRILLPAVVIFYYATYLIALLVIRWDTVKSSPIILAVLCSSLVFQLFVHMLPFSRQLISRIRGERVVFEDPLLFWTGEGEIQEWSQEDVYGSMKDLNSLPMIQDIIESKRITTRERSASIAGDI